MTGGDQARAEGAGMTASEHYAEAERLLALADTDVSENWKYRTGEHKTDILLAASVHATLASAYYSANRMEQAALRRVPSPSPQQPDGHDHTRESEDQG